MEARYLAPKLLYVAINPLFPPPLRVVPDTAGGPVAPALWGPDWETERNAEGQVPLAAGHCSLQAAIDAVDVATAGFYGLVQVSFFRWRIRR